MSQSLKQSPLIIAGAARGGTTLISSLCALNNLGHAEEHFKVSEYNNPFSRAIASGRSTEEFASQLLDGCVNHRFATKLMWPWVESMLWNSANATHGAARMLINLFPQAKFVYVVRQNKVEQAISLIRAATTNEWTSRRDDRSENFKRWPQQIDNSQIHQTILSLKAHDHQWDLFFGQNNIVHLKIFYEQLVDSTEATMIRVGEFVDGENFKLLSIQTDLRMQRDDRTAEIKNLYLSRPLTQ